MKSTEKSIKTSNLINKKGLKKINPKHDYKAEYTRLFPTKMSSSNFLSFYTLHVLAKQNRPLYGKEILAFLQDTIGSAVWKPSHGTLYPILNKLTANNLIENIKIEEDKKYYAITELGRDELEIKMREFKPMIIESYKFFSKLIEEIYGFNEDQNDTTTS